MRNLGGRTHPSLIGRIRATDSSSRILTINTKYILGTFNSTYIHYTRTSVTEHERDRRSNTVLKNSSIESV